MTNISFNEYYEIIYFNTNLTREQAKEIAIDFYDKDIDYWTAIEMINKFERNN